MRMRYPRTVVLLAMLALTIVATVSTARAQTAVGTITQIQGGREHTARRPEYCGRAEYAHSAARQITTQPGASLTIGWSINSSLQPARARRSPIDESVLVNGVGAPSKVGLLGGKLHTLIVGAMRGSTTTFEVHTSQRNRSGSRNRMDYRLRRGNPLATRTSTRTAPSSPTSTYRMAR